MSMDERQQSGAEPGSQHAADIGILRLRRKAGSSGFLGSLALGLGQLCGAFSCEVLLVGSGSGGLFGARSRSMGIFLLRNGEPPLAKDGDRQRQPKQDAALRDKQSRQRISPAKNAIGNNGVIMRQVRQRGKKAVTAADIGEQQPPSHAAAEEDKQRRDHY